jgi:hypothetical protein
MHSVIGTPSAIATQSATAKLTPEDVQQDSIRPQTTMEKPPASETKDLAGNI